MCEYKCYEIYKVYEDAGKSAKTNLSGTTSKGNNAIQNSDGLSKADNYNCRKYDDRENDIEFIRGTNSIVNDVKKHIKMNLKKQELNTIIDKLEIIERLKTTLLMLVIALKMI